MKKFSLFLVLIVICAESGWAQLLTSNQCPMAPVIKNCIVIATGKDTGFVRPKIQNYKNK
jgi:hypothetical protein